MSDEVRAIDDIDHEYTDEVVCPHCGHKHRDSYDFFGDSDEDVNAECDECGGVFVATRNVSIDYSTRKKVLQ